MSSTKIRKQIRFGIIGLGLMGREFATAAARWAHLLTSDAQPIIVGICDTNPALFPWFRDNFASVAHVTTDYRDLLAAEDIDAIYCAVPHNLHAAIYCDIIRSGKHLLGEKPFGIDREANAEIMATIADNPQVTVACSSEFPYFPGAQRVLKYLDEGKLGQVVEVEAGFLHSSDLNPKKAINWKRMIPLNGAYGCMGDLGMHALHIPLRRGWRPNRVYAALSNIVTERPTNGGEIVPCETWDNATLLTEVSAEGSVFPMTIKTYRIAPGETNTWYLRVIGTHFSAEFSTKYPKTLRFMRYQPGDEQIWGSVDLGYESIYPTITGGIFEFGFTDAILQMWAAFCDQLVNGLGGMSQPFYCATPDETVAQHAILTAALESHAQKRAIAVE